METPINILLVDDEPRNLTALESILDSPDYDLTKVQSGPEALMALLTGDFALLVLDIEMPGMNGVDALRGIRAIDSAIPVIMVTGSESTRLAGDVIKGGAFSYLPKPVRLQYLEHLAATVLQP